MSSAQERFDAALDALAHADDPEYDIDPVADALRVKETGDTYSWVELPDHVRDHWRERASVLVAQAEDDAEAYAAGNFV